MSTPKGINVTWIIYQANISTKEDSTDEKAYIDITALNWKYRYYNHTHFKIQQPYLNTTGLWKS